MKPGSQPMATRPVSPKGLVVQRCLEFRVAHFVVLAEVKTTLLIGGADAKVDHD